MKATCFSTHDKLIFIDNFNKSSLALEPLGRPRSVDVSLFNGSHVCSNEKPCCFIMSKWKHVNNFWKYSYPEPLNKTNHILNCELTLTTLLPCWLVYFQPWFSLPRLSLLHWNIFPFASRPSYIKLFEKRNVTCFIWGVKRSHEFPSETRLNLIY